MVLLLLLVSLEAAAISTSPTTTARSSVFLSKSSANDNSAYKHTVLCNTYMITLIQEFNYDYIMYGL